MNVKRAELAASYLEGYLQTIKRAKQDDEKDRKSSLPAAVGLGTAGLQTGYGLSLMNSPVFQDMSTAQAEELLEDLYAANPDLRRVKEVGPSMIPAGPHYNPKNDSIGYSGKAPSSGILAHELGHAQQKWTPKRMKLQQFSRLGAQLSPLAALYAGVSKDEDKARNAAIGSTAVSLPMLFNEYDASRRGAKMLRNLPADHPALRALQSGPSSSLRRRLVNAARRNPYIGLPTYALMASIPGLTYGAKKLTGGYEDE